MNVAYGIAAPPHFRTIALIVGTAFFMEQLDGTVLATALPGIAHDLGVNAPTMSIAITSYLISLAIFIPASGKIADRYGGRNVFRAAILIFTLGSILCAQSSSVAFLVIARLVQGMGGAMMIPVGRLVLFRSIEKRDMVSAMSWVLMPAMLGPIIGPPLGGFIVTYLNWRWIFYINIPIGILGMTLVSLFIEQLPPEAPKPFDLSGMFLSGMALCSLLFGFELTSHPGQLGLAVALLTAGLIVGALYLRHSKRTPHPILDPNLMRVSSFRTSLIAGSVTRITQGAQPFLLPLMMQLGFGMTAMQSGLMALATALGSVMMKPVAPRILRNFGFRDTLVINGFLGTSGYALCALFRPNWPFPVMFAMLVACGFFMSFQFTAYNIIAYDKITPPQLSSATSFYTTFQQLMLSMGVCTAAIGLQAAMALRGDAAPRLPDFSIAFLLVTAISLFASVWNVRFDPRDGVDFSGHAPRTWSLRQALREMRGLNP